MDAPSSGEFKQVLARFHLDVKTFSGVKPSASDAVLSLLEEALGEERAALLGDPLALHGQSSADPKLKWFRTNTICGYNSSRAYTNSGGWDRCLARSRQGGLLVSRVGRLDCGRYQVKNLVRVP